MAKRKKPIKSELKSKNTLAPRKKLSKSLKSFKKPLKKVSHRTSKVKKLSSIKKSKSTSKRPSSVQSKRISKISKQSRKRSVKREPKRKPSKPSLKRSPKTLKKPVRKPVRRPIKKSIRPTKKSKSVRRKSTVRTVRTTKPVRRPKPKPKKKPKKLKPKTSPSPAVSPKEKIVEEEGETIGQAERDKFYYDLRKAGAKIGIRPEEGGTDTYLDASFTLVDKEEDLTEDGFSTAWEDLLFGIYEGRTSGSENARVQILIDPSLPIDTEVRRSKYDFSKKGGMMTGWYKPEDWKQCSEAGIGIMRKIVTFGWGIKTVRINATYQKPSKSERMVLATLKRK